jgi:hypothetical protein
MEYSKTIHELNAESHEALNRCWWKEDKEKAGPCAYSVYRQIAEDDTSRIEDYKQFYRLYTNQDPLAFSSGARLNRRRVTWNLL